VIEIVGTRQGQALKIDRRTYQVQQTPHSAQKDAIQLLRGLPGEFGDSALNAASRLCAFE